MNSTVRVSLRVVAALMLWCSYAAATDLEIVSTMNFESGGKKYLQPCVHNNAGEPRQAHFKVGSAGVRWSFRAMSVPAGQTACFALDAPPIAPGVVNDVRVE